MKPVSVKLTSCKGTKIYHFLSLFVNPQSMKNNSVTESRFRFFHYCFHKGDVPLFSCPVSNV